MTDNVADWLEARIARGLGEPIPPRAPDPPPIAPDVATTPERAHSIGMADERLAKLEGAYDSLKVVRPMTISVLGVLTAVVVFSLTFLSTQVSAVKSDVSQLRSDMQTEFRQSRSEFANEFRAMRAESAAQTSAIAGSITATRQQAPQVILLPAPAPAAPAEAPRP